MPHLLILAALSASAHASPACDRYMVDPSPAQGMSDAALVRRASHHDAGPRNLGAVLATPDWRIVWAIPDDSEPGIFFFHGRNGRERFVDVWGGPTSDRVGAYRWATEKVGAPPALARCFARRLVAKGL